MAPPHPEAARASAADFSLPPARSFGAMKVTPPQRSNAEMARDFLDLSFRLENGREIGVFSRFDEPVTVRLAGAIPPSAHDDLSRLLARLHNEAGIDITEVAAGAAAITIEFLPRQKMQRYVPRAACFVVPRISSWRDYRTARRTDLDWTTLARRDRAAIFVPSDTSPQEIRDCLHEELAQALGPLNDLYRLPDSVFNDDNIHAVLTGFDMLMLRVTYAPELASGMTRDAVAGRLPAILDRLNPRLYFLLGRVYLEASSRKLAYETFQSGLRVDPSYRPLVQALVGMGVRKRPVVGFLHRDNMINVGLGKIMHAIKPRKK